LGSALPVATVVVAVAGTGMVVVIVAVPGAGMVVVIVAVAGPGVGARTAVVVAGRRYDGAVGIVGMLGLVARSGDILVGVVIGILVGVIVIVIGVGVGIVIGVVVIRVAVGVVDAVVIRVVAGGGQARACRVIGVLGLVARS